MSIKIKPCIAASGYPDTLPKMPKSKVTWVSQKVMNDFNKRKHVYPVRGNVQSTHGGD